ncbi:farnesyl pyrophosphate synthase-like isoform X2 [Oryza glaberrima]|uniref:farnesyl pyrophosphate synthase-like isoform X2 n=1 Tax=Oryza glaberrima TaxID=4538 RepID=UPI00224BFD8B|nr:farnesyl pyrophosphate synthase-like isoform X2 [Oryza glaberrima]
MSMQEMLRIGDDDGRSDALERELKEKLRLRGDASPAKCTRQEQRWRSDHGIVDARERFVQAYGRLRDDLVGDDSCELTDEARRWLAQMIDYNVPGGKLNRGLSVIDSYLLLKQGSEVTEDDFFLACVLGWCVEWFQACALLLDDIMDDSHTRRDQICWYRRPEVGLRGINDGIILKCHILIMIKKYFREKPYFLDLLEIWSEIALQTSLGQMLDLIGTHTGADDLAKYSIEGYRRIVKYKTAYYSFYLPQTLEKRCRKNMLRKNEVANALLLSGAKLEDFSGLKDILIEMGIYFQIQDDYLDCFADPNTIGKIGTDIEDHKCSWLIVQALGHADNNQIEVLHRNYGKKDSSSVSEVKRTYAALDLKDIFSEFERRCYNHLVTSIEAQKDHAAREILKSFLKKIHQRKK